METRESLSERATGATEEYLQHMNLERSFAIQISSRGDLTSPTMRNKRSQIGIENDGAPFSYISGKWFRVMHVFADRHVAVCETEVEL